MTGNKGVNRLARAFDERTKVISQTPAAFELGKIQADLSLKVDGFAVPIPKSHYLVCRAVTLSDPLKSGDRVAVAWTNEGTDPVVIDVVVS